MQSQFNRVFLFSIIILVTSQCSDKKEDPGPGPETPKVYPTADFTVKNVGSTVFTVNVQVTKKGDQAVSAIKVEHSASENFSSPVTTSLATTINTDTDRLQKKFTELTPNTTYYARSVIQLSDTTIYSPAVEIKTLAKQTFYKYEPNPEFWTAIWANPKLSFVNNGKGYAFIWNSNNSKVFLAEYDPLTDAWKNTLVTNQAFIEAFLSKMDMTSFAADGRVFIAFGQSGTNSAEGMNRKVFEIDLETAALTDLPEFVGDNLWRYESITVDDRPFVFAMESMQDGDDIHSSITVHEFNLETLSWERKDAITTIRSDLFLPFVVQGNLYVMATRYGGDEIKDVFEYNIGSSTLSMLPAPETPLIPDERVQGSFIYDDKVYYISVGDENQYLSVFNPSNSTNTLIATYPKETNVDDVVASFMIDNVIYTMSLSKQFYAIEL